MASLQHDFDVVVLGGGAAGLMCAIEAGKRGRRVLLLEHADRVGKKILISGGGRCNFTNLHCRPENFLSANPHFAKSALARYTPGDFIRLVESYGIAYHEKTLGQLFCDESAKQIVAMLLSECAQVGVRVAVGARVRGIEREEAEFVVRLEDSVVRARALVIATGGLSIPKMGATGFGYDVARQFGVAIREPRPALVPLVLGGAELAKFAELTGVSAEVVASVGKRRFREKLLFTHRGLSGPAVLQISSYWNGTEAVRVDWAPEQEIFGELRASSAGRSGAAARAALRAKLPARLADRLLEVAAPASWTNPALSELERRLHAWAFAPAGTEGYEKAEVTAGGVDTDALSAQTMECRDVPGLYFIGEVVDVTGQLGGFNFQWAWASGAAAGRAV
ncbi:MAG: NAD(P)/FAD-dependent oxidoreductase [Acidobacteriota bacterium]